MTSSNVKTLKVGNQEVALSLNDRRVLNHALGRRTRPAMRRLIGERWATIPQAGRHAALTQLRDQLRSSVNDIAVAPSIVASRSPRTCSCGR